MTTGSEDLDAIRGLCEDDEQRLVLALLVDQQRPLTVNDLAKTIVEYEHDAPITDVDDGAVRETQLVLENGCVPTLAEEGLVEFDRDRQLVVPTERFDDAAEQIASVLDGEPGLETTFES